MWFRHIELSPGENVTLYEYTADWNMTGLHIESGPDPNGGVWAAARYDHHFVPPGQYIATWLIDIRGNESLVTIPFEITK